jgi:hypothetical protein
LGIRGNPSLGWLPGPRLLIGFDWLCLAYSAEWEAGTGHSEAVEASSAYALTSERALSPFPRFAAPLVMTNLNARLAQVNFRQAFSLPAPMIQSAWQHGILYHLLAWLYSPYLPTRSTLVISANAASSCSCSWLLHGGMVEADPLRPVPAHSIPRPPSSTEPQAASRFWRSIHYFVYPSYDPIHPSLPSPPHS